MRFPYCSRSIVTPMPDTTLIDSRRHAPATGTIASRRGAAPTPAAGTTPRSVPRLVLVGDAENLIVRRHAAWFGAHGFQVHLVHCPMQRRSFETAGPIAGVSLHPGLGRPEDRPRKGAQIRAARNLHRTLRRLDPEIIHLMSPRIEAQSAVRFTPAKARVFSPWGADVLADAPRSPWARWRTRRLLAGFDSMVAASPALADRARSFVEARYERIIPWGVDLRVFRPDRDIAEIRERLRLDPDQRIIASPRQLGEKYNHDVILRAFAAIAPEFPDHVLALKFSIVQGDLEMRIRRLARELGIEDRLRLLGPTSAPEESHLEMADLLSAAEIAISVPSWDGGTPATIFESLASGAVPIVSDIDTNREIMTPDHEARFCRPGDVEDLARAIREGLDPKWRAQAAAAGHALARARFDRDAHLERLAWHYRDLLIQRGPSSV